MRVPICLGSAPIAAAAATLARVITVPATAIGSAASGASTIAAGG